jgi:hypothetical protein
MDLVSPGDRRSLEKRQSDVSEGTKLGRPGGKIFSPQKGEIGAWGAECDPVAFAVGPHAGKVVAARHLALEMVDTGGLHPRSRRLVVAAVPIEPGDRVGIGAPV